LLEMLPADGPLRPYAQEVTNAGTRAAALTKQLLLFSRQDVQQLQVLDLREVVRDLERMLGRLIGEDIELTASAESAVGLIEADRSQIEQVLLNLVVTARDAMPHGGQIPLTTANATREETAPLLELADAATEYVLLSIQDTGTGMDEATKARIFEPFF